MKWILKICVSFAVKYRCTRIRQECVYPSKSKYDLMRIVYELIFIPQTIESIGCCMIFPNFEQFFFIFNQMLSIGLFGMRAASKDLNVDLLFSGGIKM